MSVPFHVRRRNAWCHPDQNSPAGNRPLAGYRHERFWWSSTIGDITILPAHDAARWAGPGKQTGHDTRIQPSQRFPRSALTTGRHSGDETAQIHAGLLPDLVSGLDEMSPPEKPDLEQWHTYSRFLSPARRQQRLAATESRIATPCY